MRRWRGDDGSVAVETALVAPVLLVLMMLVVYAGRASQADNDVRVAAARAARAASIAADPIAAEVVAQATAAANLATAGIACRTQTVRLDAADFRAGGSVSVTVACQVSNGDIALLAVPGTRWSVATATQPIDTHRGGG